MKKKNTKLYEWQTKIRKGNFKCEKCGKESELTVDHIIPVVILDPLYPDIGLDRYSMIYNDTDNFQILCKYCNKQKGCRLDVRNPKTIPLLKRLIQQLEDYENTNLENKTVV